MNSTELLRRVSPEEVGREAHNPVDAQTLRAAGEIVDRVRSGGAGAVRSYAERFAERTPGQPLVLGRDAMRAAIDHIDAEDIAAIERVHERIFTFAKAQLDAIGALDVPVPGGRAGHTIEPIAEVGCYAPAGRYPLPSSVLMTAATARAAGCDRVVVASPGAHPVTLAAAWIAGADEFLAVGGAHAVAALAFGIEGLCPVDKIIGPGNRWVTAAKQLVSSAVGIDMLAGPSELGVLADDSAEASVVAADLLAQAEHDTDAVVYLVTTSERLVEEVQLELGRQLFDLPTRNTARAAVRNGLACVTRDLDEAVALVNTLAPEHLEIMTHDPEGVAARVRHAGALFVGDATSEALGDYGIGPNHTLPTGGTARFRAGLSVLDLVRVRTWIRVDTPNAMDSVLRDIERLANLEGLTGHARSVTLESRRHAHGRSSMSPRQSAQNTSIRRD